MGRRHSRQSELLWFGLLSAALLAAAWVLPRFVAHDRVGRINVPHSCVTAAACCYALAAQTAVSSEPRWLTGRLQARDCESIEHIGSSAERRAVCPSELYQMRLAAARGVAVPRLSSRSLYPVACQVPRGEDDPCAAAADCCRASVPRDLSGVEFSERVLACDGWRAEAFSEHGPEACAEHMAALAIGGSEPIPACEWDQPAYEEAMRQRIQALRNTDHAAAASRMLACARSLPAGATSALSQISNASILAEQIQDRQRDTRQVYGFSQDLSAMVYSAAESGWHVPESCRDLAPVDPECARAATCCDDAERAGALNPNALDTPRPCDAIRSARFHPFWAGSMCEDWIFELRDAGAADVPSCNIAAQ